MIRAFDEGVAIRTRPAHFRRFWWDDEQVVAAGAMKSDVIHGSAEWAEVPSSVKRKEEDVCSFFANEIDCCLRCDDLLIQRKSSGCNYFICLSLVMSWLRESRLA